MVTCQVKGNIRDNKRKTKHIFLFSSNYYNYNTYFVFTNLPIHLPILFHYPPYMTLCFMKLTDSFPPRI